MTSLPLLASLATEVFSPPKGFDRSLASGRRWFIEPKIDGHRVLIDYRGDAPRILNRNGRTYSAGPFRLTVPDSFRGYVLDGEYLPEARQYVAFDCLKHPDDPDLDYDRPIATRHDLLAAAHDWHIDDDWHLMPRHRASQEWIDFYRQEALAGGIRVADGRMPIDGVLFKRAMSGYTPGRGTDAWLKMKFLADIDCFVSALNIDGKSNCELSLHDPLSDTTFAVGKASTAGKKVTLNSVVTVRFLKFTGKRLREPRIVQVRDDKTPPECEISQLIPFVPGLKEDA